MGKVSRDERSSGEKSVGKREDEIHPVDQSNWFSFATFSWMTSFMFKFHRQGLKRSDIPKIPVSERCKENTANFDAIWTRERAFSESPDLGKVIWIYCRREVLFTSFIYFISIVLGFIGPTFLMKKVLKFSSQSEANLWDGGLWISLLILCELLRVFYFTLTWALSYRTALRIKTACMGLTYRKLFRLNNLNDSEASKLMNVICSDCTRLYDVITSCQVAIGGPIVLILSIGYILYELGWLSLIGMSVFPIAYPVQYFLAKYSGALKRKAIICCDERIALITQTHDYKRTLEDVILLLISSTLVTRSQEMTYLKRSNLFQSFSIVLGPTLPHVAAITTFILYVNSGNVLTPAQAFCVIALFIGRIRPTLSKIRGGFRSYINAKISLERLKCFTIIFVFSLLNFSIRMVNLLAELFIVYRIVKNRMKSILTMDEIWDERRGNYGSNTSSFTEAIVLDDVTLIRRGPTESEGTKRKKKSRRKATPVPAVPVDTVNSVEKLLTSSSSSPADHISFYLRHLNLSIDRGTLVGICGSVGTGKTTFMEALAGSLAPEKGTLHIMQKPAYASQDPWIFKGTIRDNIIFGESFDSVRYYRLLDECCLVNDIGNMPLADLTEINEKGTNLSGGQRQRISLARALYCKSREIYLLDDIFSGLDARVSKSIFERVIKDLKARNKTVILVTHQMNFLQGCDEILVFAEGTIAERGSHEKLMSVEHSYYAELYNSFLIASNNNYADVEEETEEEILLDDSIILDCSSEETPEDILPRKKPSVIETSIRGSIPCAVYGRYIKHAGGWIVLLVVLTAFAVSIGSTSFSSWWLKQWFNTPGLPPISIAGNRMDASNSSTSLLALDSTESYSLTSDEPYDSIIGTSTLSNETKASVELDHSEEFEFISLASPNFKFNRDVYAGIIVVILFTSFIRTILFVFATIRASRNIHKELIHTFLCSRIKSIYKAGTGMILNIFSRDLPEIDSGIPNIMETFLQNIFIVLSIFTLVTLIFPIFLLPLAGLSLMFIWVRNIFNNVVRELKREETDSKTPILSRVTETVSGLSTIRALGKERMLIQSFEKMTDDYHAIFYTFISSIRWMAVRLDLMAVGVTGLTAFLILIFHGNVSTAAAGLALAYAAQLSGVFQYTVRMASETEAKFVSMERIQNFSKNCVPEVPSLDLEGAVEGPLSLARNWPYAGNVKFVSVALGYSSGTRAALKDVSFEVFAGQKIGIVGRTGSGKSSIGNVLFRLSELKSGSIYIDDVDISRIPLGELRNSICVIPQEPSIFQRSIRFNLDPGNLYTDKELYDVLEVTGLRGSVDNLDIEVGLSQGQKQLLSIARALLRDSKVVFVDEATSNVDVETAAMMDKLLAEQFSSSTVFIVAHRLAALSYCDHILVMEEGRVRDFGPASVVRQKPEFLINFDQFESIPL